jgi:hypothetical protein
MPKLVDDGSLAQKHIDISCPAAHIQTSRSIPSPHVSKTKTKKGSEWKKHTSIGLNGFAILPIVLE